MATELQPAEVQSWWKVITDFPGYWDSFNTNYQALLQEANYVYANHPEMKPEVDRLVTEGSQLYTQLVGVKNAIDGVQNAFSNAGTTIEGWLHDAGGYVGGAYDSVKAWLGLSGLSALGILPIIWAGMAVGTAAGILIGVSNWLTSVQATATRLNRIHELEAQGMTAPQAAAQVSNELGAPGDSSATFFGVPLKWILVIGVTIFVVPPLLNYLSVRKRR